MDKVLNFLYRLFFDREDSLDTLQVLFTAIVVITLMVVWRLAVAADEQAAVKIESLVTLRWLTGLLVITAVPKWMIPAIMQVLTKSALPQPASPPLPQESYDPPTESPQ